jgi:hypothetical protein
MILDKGLLKRVQAHDSVPIGVVGIIADTFEHFFALRIYWHLQKLSEHWVELVCDGECVPYVGKAFLLTHGSNRLIHIVPNYLYF